MTTNNQITQTGTIIKIDDKKAFIKVTVNSACKSCDAKCTFAGEKNDKIIEVPSHGLNQNQRVSIKTNAKNVVKGSALIYLIPSIIIVIFAVLGAALGAKLGLKDANLGTFFGVLCSLLVIAAFIILATKVFWKKRLITVTPLEVEND